LRPIFCSGFCSLLWSPSLYSPHRDIPFNSGLPDYPTHHSSGHRWQIYPLSSTSSAPVVIFFIMNPQTRSTREIDCPFRVYHAEPESMFLQLFVVTRMLMWSRLRLKCDKGHPCDSCTKRGDESSCSYRNDLNTTQTRNTLNGSRNRAQERLQHLEGLVMQLMQSETSVKAVSMPGSTE
jgi:hypothetical protein